MAGNISIDQNAQENIDKNIKDADLKIQPYDPTSENCNTTGTVVPISLKYEQMKAVETVDRRVNGVDAYIMEKLEYDDLGELCKMFSAEQVDGLALAIYNFENRSPRNATIIGDGTGVGKGRQAAGLIRYAHKHNMIPVFITEKPNLFSDIYRDLIDIKADDGVVVKYLLSDKKQQKKRIDRKSVEAAIVEDINNGDFELDYNLSLLQSNINAEATGFTSTFKKTDEFKKLMNEYIDMYFTAEYEEVNTYAVNKDYAKQAKAAKNRMIPFVVNGRTPKTIITDKDGNVIYEPNSEQVRSVIKSGDFELYEDGDFILATYSQFRSAGTTQKKQWLLNIAPKCLFILDESHNAAGASNTGKYFGEVIRSSKGCQYLSATFAKRPDNMAIYSEKTAIGDAGLTPEQLEVAFSKGGIALQEVVSGQLTKEGQYIRRERSYEGVSVEYRTMDETQETDYQMPQLNLADVHIGYCDKITEIVRDIISFQKDIVDPMVYKMDEEYAESQGGAEIASGDVEGGISNSPAFSGIFNLINQMLMAINAEATAILAIDELKKGRKPIIALANTMESFLDDVKHPDGTSVQVGDEIEVDFKHVLLRRLKNSMRYRVDNGTGDVEVKFFDPNELGQVGYTRYMSILQKITNASTGLVFSPIDLVRKMVTEAGFTFKEVTGRDRMININDDGTGVIINRKKEPVNAIFREFNMNIVDCLLINQSGATGASAHAMIMPGKVDVVHTAKNGTKIIPNSIEPRNEVKQRTMLILQAELDINFEVQKRGRINRTGQVFPPRYIYMTSAIPAQQRLLMMLQKKLKSLDANSTGNQKQSTKILDIEDFLNKIGDNVVVDFLIKNPKYIELTGDPLRMLEDGSIKADLRETMEMPDRANKVAGRVAILPVSMQKEFYENMNEMYRNEVQRLKQMDEYDLEVEFLNYHAKTVSKTVIQPGDLTKQQNYFTRPVVLEKIEIDNLKKPFKMAEIQTNIYGHLSVTDSGGNSTALDPIEYTQALINEMKSFYQGRLENNLLNVNHRFDKKLKEARDAAASDKKQKKTAEELKQVIDQIESDKQNALQDEKSLTESIIKRNTRIMEYFIPGRVYKYPALNFSETGSYQYSVFMGYKLNRKATNPFSASNIHLEFAMDNSLKQVSVASSDAIIQQIWSLNDSWFFENQSDIINGWDDLIKESSANRINRYVLTGNLLKAFTAEAQLGAEFKGGRLVSFNLESDPRLIRRGYLLPNTFSIKGGMESIQINVPIYYLTEYFKTASNPDYVLKYTSTSYLEVFVSANSITLSFKGSKSDYKEYIEDETLRSLFNSDFRISKGSAVISTNQPTSSIISYLWNQYKVTIMVSQAMAEGMGIDTEGADESEDTETIQDPLVDINKEFTEEEARIKQEEENQKEQELVDAEVQRGIQNDLEVAQRRLAAEKKLDVFLSMLI